MTCLFAVKEREKQFVICKILHSSPKSASSRVLFWSCGINLPHLLPVLLSESNTICTSKNSQHGCPVLNVKTSSLENGGKCEETLYTILLQMIPAKGFWSIIPELWITLYSLWAIVWVYELHIKLYNFKLLAFEFQAKTKFTMFYIDSYFQRLHLCSFR
jgi:hypothetical protein